MEKAKLITCNRCSQRFLRGETYNEDEYKDICPSCIMKELMPKDDMKLAKEEFDRCFELMKSRNKAYGNSWKVLSVQAIANLMEMKMNRIAKLGEIDTKVLDEFQDCANYAIFALLKLRK